MLARFPGCRTAKVKVAEPGQTLADDVARVRAVRAALGAGGPHPGRRQRRLERRRGRARDPRPRRVRPRVRRAAVRERRRTRRDPPPHRTTWTCRSPPTRACAGRGPARGRRGRRRRHPRAQGAAARRHPRPSLSVSAADRAARRRLQRARHLGRASRWAPTSRPRCPSWSTTAGSAPPRCWPPTSPPIRCCRSTAASPVRRVVPDAALLDRRTRHPPSVATGGSPAWPAPTRSWLATRPLAHARATSRWQRRRARATCIGPGAGPIPHYAASSARRSTGRSTRADP